MITYLYDNLEATGSRVFQFVIEPTNEVEKNDVALVCSYSHCKEEIGDHVLQKSP